MSKIPEAVRLTRSPTAQAVFGLIPYTDKKEVYSLADIMMITNSAFMINIHPETVDAAGPTLFSPTQLMGDGLMAMGFDIGESYYEIPATPEQLEQYVKFIKDSIDRGLPVIGWDLFCPEFGIIYGYDDEKQELYARDAEKDGIIAYSEINNRRYSSIHAMAVLNSSSVDPLDTLEDSLQRAVHFLDEKNHQPSSQYHHGIAGYDAWMQAFMTRHIHIPENAYNLAVVTDGRKFAAQFFGNFSESIFSQTSLGSQLAPLALEAAAHYSVIAETLSELLLRFPFPQGGEPNNQQEAEHAIKLLNKVKTSEINGLAVMSQMLELVLNRKREAPLSLGKFKFPPYS
ncbi:hypothetical protein EHS13_04505 [Paenibacillus psychroresistens]|uniref:Uncharacterized protein n=1 Tax=Paenibacillus psychroresistens TaxID=1778678 RepID=A0A6B8RE57_9BACL|nr:hypothetical protein [Paenibacillus psychroresistens]QGQ94217.1 hypothetical protein EHS13_04505 [Paenibacillus psychroresistens]